MAKYAPPNNLAPEQRREIAFLVNAGIPRKVLAEGYNVPVHTIGNIAYRRDRWLSQEGTQITPEQKFSYLQSVYADEAFSPQAKRSIEHYLIDPAAARVAKNLSQSLSQEPFKMLLSDIGIPTDGLDVDYSMLVGLSLVALKQNVTSGTRYLTIDDAVGGIAPSVMELREAALTAEQKDMMDTLKSKVNEALADLPQRQREAVELRYGIVGNHPRTFEEVGKELGGITYQAARTIWLKAFRKLTHSNQARELKDLLK